MRSVALDINKFAADPAVPVITQGGTPATTAYGYKVVAKNADGGASAASPEGTTATGAAALGETDYNTVTWSAVPGATAYDVYRTAGGATQGKIGTVSAPTVTLDDTGLAASGAAPSTNTSGIGDATTVDAPEQPRLVAIEGTFVATLQVEASVDGGNSWGPCGSPAQAPGLVRVPRRAKQVRIRETGYTSGTPSASLVVAQDRR